jgi:hypothetical protein
VGWLEHWRQPVTDRTLGRRVGDSVSGRFNCNMPLSIRVSTPELADLGGAAVDLGIELELGTRGIQPRFHASSLHAVRAFSIGRCTCNRHRSTGESRPTTSAR